MLCFVEDYFNSGFGDGSIEYTGDGSADGSGESIDYFNFQSDPSYENTKSIADGDRSEDINLHFDETKIINHIKKNVIDSERVAKGPTRETNQLERSERNRRPKKQKKQRPIYQKG